ncbi:hypothetical protein J7F03_00700 [Streptomyces sp. ISL-43]|uniref:hypothetical protein n=1 Tax=Streptomyces sp. ISL-43 TaxID=2819183 RepID=UPI001BEAA154|nr:hypothetical protein [Streptomyces sp. ISL-43]MBT2445626.1 hypothetical protein [Streptomyces sp. ISL-43]
MRASVDSRSGRRIRQPEPPERLADALEKEIFGKVSHLPGGAGQCGEEQKHRPATDRTPTEEHLS